MGTPSWVTQLGPLSSGIYPLKLGEALPGVAGECKEPWAGLHSLNLSEQTSAPKRQHKLLLGLLLPQNLIYHDATKRYDVYLLSFCAPMKMFMAAQNQRIFAASVKCV